ncbi:MAG TPA: hypothetical protein VFU49_16160 [Ktedonobacteraceae bacterium]|nr:hypothetical protein [Ktedonobacteraceae bacterium]
MFRFYICRTDPLERVRFSACPSPERATTAERTGNKLDALKRVGTKGAITFFMESLRTLL